MQKHILITGAAGYVGSQLGERLAASHAVCGVDIRTREGAFPVTVMDVRDTGLADFMREKNITHVVHLASILQPGADPERDYDIDVNGTRNVLQACVEAGVGHFTCTSSGAAYGYHADNPAWLDENDALRGNTAMPYAHHKRLVEEMLAEYRQQQPQLRQLVFRPGTILGAHTNNLITDLFRKPRLLAIRGSASPFVFIWDQDVIDAIAQGIERDSAGIYNMAGDGALGIDEIGRLLGKPVVHIPALVLSLALHAGKRLGLTQYGPEQLDFLRYRPVLGNRRLKEEFGFTPAKTSEETFRFFARHALGASL